MKKPVSVTYVDGEWQVRCSRHGIWSYATRAQALERARQHADPEGRALEVDDPASQRVPPQEQEPRDAPITRGRAPEREGAGALLRRLALVQSLLEGVPLPASRDALLEYARGQHADAEVLRALEQLPRRDFVTLDEIGETLLPVQPRPKPPQQRPREESGSWPGLDSYFRPRPESGDIRETDVGRLHGPGSRSPRRVV